MKKYYSVHIRYSNGFKEDYEFPTRESAEKFRDEMLIEELVKEAYVIACESLHEHEVKTHDRQCIEDLLEYIASDPDFREMEE